MRIACFLLVTLVSMMSMMGCGSPGVPEPIKVLEDPQTGERVRFFKEIWYKVPKDYNETKHLAEWTATQEEAGYTKEITPEDDRKRLAELRAKNRAASRRLKSAN
ncbi:MAG: hypothetical protein ACYTG0_34410 [Planctomycetota bacterium]